MPTTKTPAKTLNVRLDPDTLQEVKKAASRHNMSANSFILTAIDASLKAERDREWREGFEAMGQDSDLNVEYMIPAAGEVVLGDEH